MNLWFRLIWITLFSRFRKKTILLDLCKTPFTVYPSDLDLLRHMNNGKYFSLQDLARIDYMIRSNILEILNKNNWYPVVVAETLQFKKSLNVFEKFEISTQIIGMDEKAFILEHCFLRRDEVIATGFIRARFLKKSGGSVHPQDVIKAVNFHGTIPILKETAQLWLQTLN